MKFVCIRSINEMFQTKHFVNISNVLQVLDRISELMYKYSARLNIRVMVCKTFRPRFESGWHLNPLQIKRSRAGA